MNKAIPQLSLPGLSLASVAGAQEAVSTESASAAPELFSASYLFQVLGSLVLVFVCLFAVVYFLKRFNGVGVGSGSALRVLGSVNVGQREKVVLMEVGGEQLLIGVAPGSVRRIHVLAEPVLEGVGSESASPDFAAVLRAANPLGSKS
ncbi:MAG: flagellar protein FliO/FliZ [Glaciecola sp.]|jgi:flagellar protein FliO/FliZ|uniref:flagellar biosynthetic protein FliO n=1 Tax=Congregibacter sp. TaxID=2744308 RepID=UPI0039E49096